MQNLNTQIQPDRGHFDPLRSLLEEMADTLRSCYLQSNIGEIEAIFEVGLGPDKTVWTVYPARHGQGFSIGKVQYFSADKDEDVFWFAGESEAVEYLVKEIVESIVYCQYWETEQRAKVNSAG